MHKKFSKRQLYILSVCVIITIGLICLLNAIFKLRVRYKRLEADLVTYQKKTQALDKIIEQRLNIEDAYKYIQTKNILSTETSQTQILKAIQAAADNSNVIITNIKPVLISAAKNNEKTRDIRIEAQAELISMLRFLFNLQNINLPIKLKFMQVDTTRSELLKIQFVLNAICSWDDREYRTEKSD